MVKSCTADDCSCHSKSTNRMARETSQQIEVERTPEPRQVHVAIYASSSWKCAHAITLTLNMCLESKNSSSQRIFSALRLTPHKSVPQEFTPGTSLIPYLLLSKYSSMLNLRQSTLVILTVVKQDCNVSHDILRHFTFFEKVHTRTVF